ncbi:MAG TPA: PhzF family phenazine biosynthesis protein, partial [Candidatus Angelobacter sp.]|nr:PhzF family phenazine biosynthesis protein [Candidatus Angelobacter sp.]
MSNQRRKLPFVQLDVFTSTPLEGNQLAVFPDGRGLTDADMQALAREMNLSETTFIIPRDPATEREKGVRVRIFTVTEELPFAGHPTLGTAMVLRGDNGADRIILDLNIGRIPVQFTTRDGLAFGQMTQRDPEFGQIHSREEVARAAEISINDIADDVPIQTVSTGNAFAMVPVRSLSVLQMLAPSWSSMKSHLSKSDAKFFYFISRETLNHEAKLQARMIFYGGEDPATGSAAGPCIGWAVKHGIVAPEEQALIEQGVEMNRMSRIYGMAGKIDYKIVNIRVGG